MGKFGGKIAGKIANKVVGKITTAVTKQIASAVIDKAVSAVASASPEVVAKVRDLTGSLHGLTDISSSVDTISSAMNSVKESVSSQPDFEAKIEKANSALSGLGNLGQSIAGKPEAMASGIQADPNTAMTHANQLESTATAMMEKARSAAQSATEEESQEGE